jgi:hypothetical protein
MKIQAVGVHHIYAINLIKGPDSVNYKNDTVYSIYWEGNTVHTNRERERDNQQNLRHNMLDKVSIFRRLLCYWGAKTWIFITAKLVKLGLWPKFLVSHLVLAKLLSLQKNPHDFKGKISYLWVLLAKSFITS